MSIIEIIKSAVSKAVSELYGIEIESEKVNLSSTRKEFEGDYTIVVFPFTKAARKTLCK